MSMNKSKTKKPIWVATVGFFLYLVLQLLDVVLVLELKETSEAYRWLWLPLIAFGISVIGRFLVENTLYKYSACRVLAFITMLWGVARGLIIGEFYLRDAYEVKEYVLCIVIGLIPFLLNMLITVVRGYGLRTYSGVKKKSNPKKPVWVAVIGAVLYVFLLAVDVVMVFKFKEESTIYRLLWLPLITLGVSVVGNYLVKFTLYLYSACRVLGKATMIWGIARGLIIGEIYIRGCSGVWDYIFACIIGIIPFLLNLLITVFGGFCIGTHSEVYKPPTYSPAEPKPEKKEPNPDPWYSFLDDLFEHDEKPEKPAPPKTGDLMDYFKYFSYPICGSGYSWSYGPYMKKVYGFSTSYEVVGIIDVDTKVVTTDYSVYRNIDYELNIIRSGVKNEVEKIIKRYYEDYPDDHTDFKVDIKLDVTIR